MGFTPKERVTLAALGFIALLGLGALLWQRQRPPLVIESVPNAEEAAHWDEALASARQIDVNTAGVAELERLPGVGPTLARRIVEYREAHGAFVSPEDLTRVPGIGPAIYQHMEDSVTTSQR